MRWYVKNSLGYVWGGPTLGWLTAKPKKFDTPNQAMQDLLNCRIGGNGEPIVFTCGIEILPDTN